MNPNLMTFDKSWQYSLNFNLQLIFLKRHLVNSNYAKIFICRKVSNILINISGMKCPINWKSFTVQQFLSLKMFNKMCFQGHTKAPGNVTKFKIFSQLFYFYIFRKGISSRRKTKNQRPKYTKNQKKYWGEMKDIFNNFWKTLKLKKKKKKKRKEKKKKEN